MEKEVRERRFALSLSQHNMTLSKNKEHDYCNLCNEVVHILED